MSSFNETRYKLSDALRERTAKVRERRVGRAGKRSSHGHAVAKAVLVCLLILVFAGVALMVGNADYQVTMIGWVPLVMLVAAVVLSWIYLQVLKHGIVFEEISDFRDCERGTEVNFSVRFINKSILFVFKLEAVFYISDLYGNISHESTSTLALGPRETYDFPFSATFEHIGNYQAGLERVVISDFLGLFTATVQNQRRHPVLVAPQTHSLGAVYFSTDAETESETAAKSVIADSMDYAYVRDYVIGDPLKTIHWKLSSRAGEGQYYTRLFERYTNPGVTVVMDFFAPDDDAQALMELFDSVVESGLSVAEYARQRGLDTEIRYSSRLGEVKRLLSWPKEDLGSIIDDLPKMSGEGVSENDVTSLLSEISQSRYGQNNVVVVTSNLSPNVVSSVLELKVQRRNPLVMFAVPAGCVGKDLDRRRAPLARFDAAGISYLTVARPEDLKGATF